MWRSKFLRRLVGVAFLAVMVPTLIEWRLREHARATDAVLDAREKLTTAALAFDAAGADVTVALGADGAPSHLSLSGPIDALDREWAETVKRIVQADLLIAETGGGAPRPVAQTIEDPQALAPRAEPASAGPWTVEVAGVERVAAQVPILRASDDAPMGFLRVYAQTLDAPLVPQVVALMASVLAFLGLVGGIVLVYASDRKVFLRIGQEIRELAQDGNAIDLTKYSPSGAVYPIMHAVHDLCQRYNAAAEKNVAVYKSEMAAHAELDGMLTQLDAEMGCLVGDLARGDFSQRILSRFDFPEIQSLADNIQAMADTMESFLKETAFVLTAMAEGDLRVEMTGTYTGEFDAVAQSANSSIRQFRALIGEVQTAVADGLQAVTRIGGSVADLAVRANEQVAAIQETAASMEQIATAVQSNTGAMVEADRMAQGVALSTQAGGVAARGAIAAVERIRDSSQEISAIVRVIETIAFQTTILALNSAIEAARAGEAGRGFSVVATEVRSLAQRSSDAAKQIKTLITSSEQMVMEGVEMVQSAGAALHEIEDGIQSLSTRIAQVARSQIEQANAVSQVNANISSIESLAAESATLCADSGAETEGLSASMERVGAQMARFQVEGEAPAGARALPAPPSTAAAPKPSGGGADGPPPWVEDDETADWTVEDWARAAAG